MRVLFVHQNFPGQFPHWSARLAEDGHEVVALGMHQRPLPHPKIRYVRHTPLRGNGKDTHPWVIDFESKVLRAEACANAAMQLRAEGFLPDLIIGHPGWGETWLLRDVWPQARMISFFEFYYHAMGHDMDFDPEFPASEEQILRLRVRNASHLVGLNLSDAGISPTHWQRSTYPVEYQPRIEVIHDGIATERLTPMAECGLCLPNGQNLQRGQEIITYIARNMEPMRGWHTFCRALPHLLSKRPKAQVIVIGGQGNSYSPKSDDGQSYFERFWNPIRDHIDLQRVHVLGQIPYPELVQVLRVSRVHVYLTYPFVLSWSMLEAMSLGALVVASNTAPVREVIEDGVNGMLVDFFDHQALAERIATISQEIERDPRAYETVRQAARQTIVDRYDLARICLPQQLALIERVMRSA